MEVSNVKELLCRTVHWSVKRHYFWEGRKGLQADFDEKGLDRIGLDFALISSFNEITTRMRSKPELAWLGTGVSGTTCVSQELTSEAAVNEQILLWCFTEKYVSNDGLVTENCHPRAKVVIPYLRSREVLLEVMRVMIEAGLIRRSFYQLQS